MLHMVSLISSVTLSAFFIDHHSVMLCQFVGRPFDSNCVAARWTTWPRRSFTSRCSPTASTSPSTSSTQTYVSSFAFSCFLLFAVFLFGSFSLFVCVVVQPYPYNRLWDRLRSFGYELRPFEYEQWRHALLQTVRLVVFRVTHNAGAVAWFSFVARVFDFFCCCNDNVSFVS